MSKFVEVKTAELVGPALDWCVCMVATGAQYHDDYGRATLVIPGAAAMMDGLKRPRYAAAVPDYSSDWALGGPLLDREISVLHNMGGYWSASTSSPFVTMMGGGSYGGSLPRHRCRRAGRRGAGAKGANQ